MRTFILTTVLTVISLCVFASQHQIGPGQTYENIKDFPWENLAPGDTIYIHYRSAPYKEKWVINAAGTSTQPILIKGVPGSDGQLPVIDGNGATTRQALDYWNDVRGVVKIGGSSVPTDGTPSWITIDNLDIQSGYKDYTFTDDQGNINNYSNNAASIYIEKGNHITIRSCTLTDSGNGLFIAHESKNILIESNYFHGNGVTGRIYEHNVYTEATGITYQYNRFGPLRGGAKGNNLKDRSAGTVIRYNYIQGGNRLMDLVDSDHLNNATGYHKTFVYGNILIEEDDGLNNQVIHYGGDSGNTSQYRKGKFYFYHNTLFSRRSGNTTLLRLSTNDEQADVRNNILIVQADGNKLALLAESGEITIKNNLLKLGWIQSHDGAFNGQINDDGSSIESNSPGFVDSAYLQLQLKSSSPAISKAGPLHPDAQATHPVNKAYKYHQSYSSRGDNDDLGGYAYEGALPAVYRHVLSGEKKNQDINLTWETLQEINISHFILLHSPDGHSWELLQQIPPSNTTEPKSYQYLHQSPSIGMNFYRLMEQNMDGTSKVINTISVETGNKQDILIYPSVTTGEVNLQIPDVDRNNPYRVALSHSNGQLIREYKSGTKHLSMAGMASGLYYLRITLNGIVKNFKVVKF